MTAPIHTELLDFIGAQAFATTMLEGSSALPSYATQILDLAFNVVRLDPRVQLNLTEEQRAALHEKGVVLLERGLAMQGEPGVKTAVRQVYESVFHGLNVGFAQPFQAVCAETKTEKELSSTEALVLHILTLCIAKEFGVKYRDVSLEKDLIRDFDADSLDMVELILCVEEDFNLEIMDEEAQDFTTVQSFFNVVLNKVMEREAAAVAFLKRRHRMQIP